MVAELSWTLIRTKDEAPESDFPDESSTKHRCLRTDVDAADLSTVKDFIRFCAFM